MKKNVFLSLILIFSLFLPVALSVTQVIDDTFISYESCQENQSEEQETEEENYNEVEAFLLNDLHIPLFFKSDMLEIASCTQLYTIFNSETSTPPPQLV